MNAFSLDPFKQYMEAFKWMFIVGCVLLVGVIGYKLGTGSNDETIAEQRTTIAARNTQIAVLVDQIKSINAAAEKAIAAEKAAKKQAAEAGKIADQAEHKAERLEDDFNKRLRAARKNPGCEALLNVDVRKVCGL